VEGIRIKEIAEHQGSIGTVMSRLIEVDGSCAKLAQDYLRRNGACSRHRGPRPPNGAVADGQDAPQEGTP